MVAAIPLILTGPEQWWYLRESTKKGLSDDTLVWKTGMVAWTPVIGVLKIR
jgi:hypothetical protein